ncbi:MAG: 2-oxo acid dehydrogenase subunit E2 [Saprospiraceae bacterium]|nr:2-oxo acid dehydrogenase subunit E2 [Saprospiraceae bacterium]
MTHFELVMPKMGESIIEATILRWTKNIGDLIEIDDTLVEIATDKVDTDVPSPVKGKLIDILFNENDVVPVGQTIAIIATEMDADEKTYISQDVITNESPVNHTETYSHDYQTAIPVTSIAPTVKSNRFYSPLVKNMALKENISYEQLDTITGTGMQGRETKNDLLNYLESIKKVSSSKSNTPEKIVSRTSGENEIIEMDRMRKLIADHMIMSKRTSAHVTSFAEADVTEIVLWREKIKKPFEVKYQQKITFTPIFIQAVAKALSDFPLINISVEGDKIIIKKDINIGMATALPSGNLIVPVIKNADTLSLPELTTKVNNFADRARNNQLKPDEVQGGTFTTTNVGTFGSIMGTPIINQPQVAILAIGAIKKKPAVVETPYGDLIAIRHLMFLSLSYDHRVVDGALGSSFLRRIADYIENFDGNQGF